MNNRSGFHASHQTPERLLEDLQAVVREIEAQMADPIPAALLIHPVTYDKMLEASEEFAAFIAAGHLEIRLSPILPLGVAIPVDKDGAPIPKRRNGVAAIPPISTGRP